MVKVFACSLINLHVRITGPTGAGKTSFAREFARIRPITLNKKMAKFLMQSFSSETKPIDCFLKPTIKDKQFGLNKGPLLLSIVNGLTIILDEFNLSLPSTMKSIAPALEPIDNKEINISGIDDPIVIHPNLFIIICENETNYRGRNNIPSSIEPRFRVFKYPELEIEDLSSTAIDISNSFYDEDEIKSKSFSNEEAGKVGEYMYKLNKSQIMNQTLSIRDLTKFFIQIHHQDVNKNDYQIENKGILKDKNMKLYMNLLFYTFASISRDEITKMFDKVLDLIGEVFLSIRKLNNEYKDDRLEELEKCFNAVPKLKSKGNKKYLEKGIFKIYSTIFDNITLELPSLLNGMFQILLCDPTEPILLVGPSGMKSFLAQQFLKNATLIALHSESTINQLLGASAFFNKEEVKLFYINYICKVCNLSHKIPQYIEKFMNGTLMEPLNKEEFQKEIEEIKMSLPESFRYSVTHLLKKLFDENKSRKSSLSNIELEFRPGLFLSAILEGKSLILKNLSNLPTNVLERFNELFSIRSMITLNEDTHGTIVSEDKRELTEFNSFLKIFATCSPDTISQLSEAVLSRFSVIWISSYEKAEQELVLESYVDVNKLKFDKSNFISKIIKFSNEMERVFHKSFSFPQMINIIEMCSRLNKHTNESQWFENLKVILFYVGYGLLEHKNKESREKFFDIFIKMEMSISDKFINRDDDENTLSFTKLDGHDCVKSKLSKIFIKSPTSKEYNPKDIACTPMFQEMIEALQLAISIKYPIILEGTMSGQGKQTAINFVAEMLGYNVVNIMISKTTKVDDLLGMITIDRDKNNEINVNYIQTKLIKAIKSRNESRKSIIVLHNLNNASPAVLDLINNLFDQHQKKLLHSDGSTIDKEELNLVGIFNQQNGLFNRDKLPSSLRDSSIYHIVNNPNNLEILNVILKMFDGTEFKKEFKEFYERFIKAQKIIETTNALPLSLNDIKKYKIFREVTYNKFDKDIVSLMVFAYRFIHHELIDQVRNAIQLPDMKFNLCITKNTEKNLLHIKPNKDAKSGIDLKVYTKAEDSEIFKNGIASLTLPQKHCLLFLICSYLSKQTCIIQGDTASGKSYLIRFFAQLLGIKLNVIQLNSETSSSIITGQNTLSNELNDKDIESFQFVIDQLKKIPEIKDYIEKEFKRDLRESKKRDFINLLSHISTIKMELKSKPGDDNKDIINQLKLMKMKIKELLKPEKRFQFKESILIKAMKNGEWILFDGIENSPPEFAEKISQLCNSGDDQEIDMVEYGENYYFTRKKLPNSQLIHEDFRIFITYNPTSQTESKQLDPVLMNKCASFTITPIDSNPEHSAQYLLGKLNDYPLNYALEISKRYANLHEFLKEKSKEGDNKITARRLKFLVNSLKNHYDKNSDQLLENVHQPIIDSMNFSYFLSFIEKNNDEFKDKMINEFLKNPNSESFLNLWYDDLVLKDKYPDLLNYLRNIQISSRDSSKSIKFNFSDFIQNCMNIHINDVPLILTHVKDTLDFISKSDCYQTYTNTKLDQEFSQLKMIENILEEVQSGMKELKEEQYDFSLKDDDLLEVNNLVHPLSRLILLSKLESNNSKCPIALVPRILFNEEFVNLMDLIYRLTKDADNTQILFLEIIKILCSNQSFIPLIESRIPYNLFNKQSIQIINYLMPLLLSLHKSQKSFHITVKDQTFDFDYLEQDPYNFELFLVFENKNELSLSLSQTYVKINGQNKFYQSQNNNDNVIKMIIEDLSEFVNDKPNIRENDISNISRLLSSRDSSLIGNIWPILFSFTGKFIGIFNNYLTILEKEAINSFSSIFSIIEKKNVQFFYIFSTKMNDFGSDQSNIYKIKNNSFDFNPKMNKKQANELIKEIDNEIIYLIENKRIIEHINNDEFRPKKWLENCIQLLEESKNPINQIIDKINQMDKNFELIQELTKLRQELYTKKTENSKLDSLKFRIINQIQEDINNNVLTKEIVFNIKKQVKTFLACFDKDLNIFDDAVDDRKGHITSEVQFYEDIIWFSLVYDIINKIKFEKDNVFQSIIQLSSFKGTDHISNILTNRLLKINNKSNGISNEDFNNIESMLNAQLLYKLHHNKNVLKKIDSLNNIFNDLEKRNPVKELVIEWIESKTNQFFDLKLPMFKPKDLLFLFIENIDKEFINPGPFTREMDYESQIKVIEILSSNGGLNFTSAKEYSNMIIQKLHKDFIPKNHRPLISKETTEIINIIAEKIDLLKNSKYKFTFNDKGFMDKEWMKDDSFIKNYPSLVYWMVKNPRLTSHLQNYFSSNAFSEDKLPFKLFALRLKSSLSCIKFECQANTKTARYLQKTINETFKDKIRNKIQKFESFNSKWINVLLPSVPFELSNPDYHMFYQFFINMSEDDTILEEVIQDKKEKAINTFVKNVCNLVFEDKNDFKITPEIEQDNKLDCIFSFIKNPNEFISCSIQSEINCLFQKIIDLPDYKNLIEHISKMKKEVDKRVNLFKISIKEELSSRNKIYEEEAQQKKNQKIKENKKMFLNYMKDYTKSFNILINEQNNMKFKTLQKHFYDVQENKSKLPKMFEENGQILSLIKFNYHKNKGKKHSIKINIEMNNKKKTEKVSLNSNQDYYFYSWQIDENKKQSIQNALPNFDLTWEPINLIPLSKTFNINTYCESNVEKFAVKKSSIHFDDGYSQDHFYWIIDNVSTKVIESVQKLDENLRSNIINKTTFETIDESIWQINNLIKSFSVKFEDGSRSKTIDDKLDSMNEYFSELYKYLIIINKELEKSIKTLWTASYQNSTSIVKAFGTKRQFKLPLSNENDNKKRFTKQLFKNIKKDCLFSNPILSADNGSIACCFKSINCFIGPIIPSLYNSKKVRVNFLSFIEEDFSIDIKIEDKEKSDKYEYLFSSKRNFSNSEMVQIFVSLPEESVTIDTKIHFTSKKLKDFILPCTFTFQMLPLSFLLSCKDHQLSCKDNGFYLCTNQLISSSKLKFTIHNYYLKEKMNYKYQLLSLSQNASPEPKINIQVDDEIEIEVPKTDNVQRLHAELKLKFTDQFSTSIFIDSLIMPFDYSFEVYEPQIRRYGKNAKIYYSSQYFQREIKLHCRIYGPSFFENFEGTISENLPKELYIKDILNLSKKFTINENKEFDVILYPYQNSNYISHNWCQSFNITINIHGIEKSISLTFIEINDQIMKYNKLNVEFINKYPTFGYNFPQNKWDRIEPNTSAIGYCILVSPFSYTLFNQVSISHNYDCEVKNSSNNKFISINSKGELFLNNSFISTPNTKNKGRISFNESWYDYSKSPYYYSIYGISENSWYPVYNIYPEIKFEELEFKDENIEKAQSNINEYEKTQYGFFGWRKKFSRTNFRQFHILLLFGSVIKNIKNIIQYLPNDVKTQFDSIIAAAETISVDDPKMIILSNNAIVLFRKVFYERFQQIKKDNFILSKCPLSKEDIEFYINESYDIYCSVDQYATDYDIRLPEYIKFQKLKEDLEELKKDQFVEYTEKNEAYLISSQEGYIPVPKNRNEEPKYVSNTNSITNSMNDMSKIKIQLPKITYVEEESFLTIEKLRDFYNSYIKGIRLLPIFVIIMKSKNDPKMEEEAIQYFEKLCQIFLNLPEKDYSFISSVTNLFNESFVSMIGKFKQAGVIFDRAFLNKCVIPNEQYQSFIEIPEKDMITSIPPEKWLIKKDSLSDDISFDVVVNPNEVDDNIDIIMAGDLNNDPSKNIEKPNQNLESTEFNEINFDEMVNEIKGEISQNFDPNIPTVITESQLKDQKASDEDSETVYIVSDSNIFPTPISQGQMDGIFSSFNEKMGIERAINRIKQMQNKIKNGNPILKIYENKPHVIKNKDFLDTKKEHFPIIKLMQNGLYLANKFFIAASEVDIPCSEFCANILIDCSSFISDINKIFNMMIICALTHALDCLGIPYSAAVIADQEFKCVIKEFDEDHSPKCLQKICDCLLIKRFRTKLASTIKFANEAMKYPKDERPYRAIFVFSDGLDEQLLLPSSWSKSIFTNDLISYGFVFIESFKQQEIELSDEKIALLDDVWKSFENNVNNGKSQPFLKIASITAEINDQLTYKLVDLFKTVMKRRVVPIESQTKIYQYENPIPTMEKLNNVNRIKRDLKVNFQKINEFYAKTTQVLKNKKSSIGKLDQRVYQNMLNKISKCELDKNINRDNIVKDFIINRINIDQTSLETVFKPNKASQLVLSSTGTEFDIIALVLNLINPVPNPMIYLEQKGGYVRNYSVSVIIDPSYSCFNDISGPHSLQTIKTILSSLATLDIQSFDLIIAGDPNPKIICFDVGTTIALSHKSSLYDSLFSVLQKPIKKPDLASAINTSFDLGRLRSSDTTSVLFVLTNGMYQNNEIDRIINSVNMCVQSGINTIGIGLGVYPKGIEKLFPQIVFSPNPSNVMKAIASLYNNRISMYNNKMNPINLSQPNPDDLLSTIKMLIENEKTPTFKSLKEELKEITPYLDAFDDMYNQEQAIYDKDKNEYINPTGANTEMYVKNLFKTQKILIVMLWDYTLNPEHEEKFVHTEYIKKPSKEGIGCIKSAVDYYGISLTIVQNYEDAIKELCKETAQGCEYYAVWVFCGPPNEILPEKDKDPNYVGEFNKVLIQFWKNGGSIVFWAEGEPLNYQVNLFLEEVEFEDEPDLKNGKTDLRIHGDHKGQKNLLPDPSGSLQKNGTFNRSPNVFKQCQRPMLSNNIGVIYEGISIGYAHGSIKPFKPFSKDSEGGISALFYPANISKGTGDIIIDCGYTKCFTKMDKDGTFRYVQNIAGWTARPEVHRIIDNMDPSEWRPKVVQYTFPEEKVIWNRFQVEPVDPKNLKALWAIDSSESVRNDAFYHTELRRVVNEYYKQGDELYLWDNKERPLCSKQELDSFISNMNGYTGTKSSKIAEIAKRSSIREHLIIVTDGTVDNGEIDLSDELMAKNNIRFKFVTTFIILDANPPDLLEIKRQYPNADIESMKLKCDLSVGAPYSRRCQSTTYVIRTANSREEMATLSSQDINVLQSIDSISSYMQFVENFSCLERAFQAATLGKEKNDDLVSKLERLRKNIDVTNLNKQQKSDFINKFNVLMRMANGALRGSFTIQEMAAAKRGET